MSSGNGPRSATAMLAARWPGFAVPTIVLDRPGWLSDGAVIGHFRDAWRHVHLDQVEVIGAQPAQALLDIRPDIGRAVVVRKRRHRAGRKFERAAALGSQEVLVPAVADIPADELL